MGDAFNHLWLEHPVFGYEPGNDRFTIESDRNYTAGEQESPVSSIAPAAHAKNETVHESRRSSTGMVDVIDRVTGVPRS